MKNLMRLLDFLFPWRYWGTVAYTAELPWRVTLETADQPRTFGSVYLNRWTKDYHKFEEV